MTFRDDARDGARSEDPVIGRLEELVKNIYQQQRVEDVPFHGWPHVSFVRTKALEFAERNGGDKTIVSAAALVHDLNYIVQRNSEPSTGHELRQYVLAKAGIQDSVARRIEAVIEMAHTASRGANLSPEAAALSDADTLFKALPITPVALSCLFRSETGLSVSALAAKIVREQLPLLKRGIYFYDAEVERRYGNWARTNIELWSQVADCVEDPDVKELLRNLGLH